MINSVQIFPCEDCGSRGLIFWGDNKQHDVESCQCAEVKLFNTQETN